MHASVAILAVAVALLVCCSAQKSSQEIVIPSDQSGTAAPDLSPRQVDVTIAEEAKNPWSWDGIKEKWTNMISDLGPKERILKILKQWENSFIKVATPELIKIAKDRQKYWKSLEKSFQKRATQEQQDNVKNATNEKTQEKDKEHKIQRRQGVSDQIANTNMNVGQQGLQDLLRRREGMDETEARNFEVGPLRPQNLLRWQGGIDEIATNMDVGQRRQGSLNEIDAKNFEAGQRRLQYLLRWQGGAEDIGTSNIDVESRRINNLLRRQEDNMNDNDATKMNIGQRRFTNNDVGQRRFQAVFHNLQ